MLEMAKLEQVEAVEDPAAGRKPPSWGVSQRLVVLGAVVLLLAVMAAAVAVCYRPPPRMADLSAETIRQEVERWPAAKVVLEYWNMKKQGLNWGILGAVDRYNRDLAIYHLWWGVSAVLGLFGVGLLVAGMARREGRGVPAQ
jgi:hypothetical protein